MKVFKLDPTSLISICNLLHSTC
uniref:Uncharacterized protein n=1 Tax=Arundo donax TaxID=35708 RepID=A0A0A9E1N3_ARUDO